ncbi:uncharacterized protein L201_007129 [Kwoniella dendrophila CBS 6074]|uniref:Uncharacterized protein n=1 Tax=Kwoniella dendrophila CBS 6074 TaxID=1295534 RepID=A0AAX4K5U2_9TREE
MTSRINNKRPLSSITSFTTDEYHSTNSGISSLRPKQSYLQPHSRPLHSPNFQHPLTQSASLHPDQRKLLNQSNDPSLSPFTHNPLSYPPPGAITSTTIVTTPTSATFSNFPPGHLKKPQNTQVPQPPQPQQREIKFIFETGRKEPKIRKTKTKDANNQKTSELVTRKVLGNKTVKDPNVSRKPKPSPLNLKNTSKLPLIDTNISQHVPSPPLTAGLFPSHDLPIVSDTASPHVSHLHGHNQRRHSGMMMVNQDSPLNSPLRISMQPFNMSYPDKHRHSWCDTLPPINTPRSATGNFVDGYDVSPPLPINAPIPRAPIQAYTPFFEDSLAIPDEHYDDKMDGEHEMDVEYQHHVTDNVNNPQEAVMGLGLDLGISRGSDIVRPQAPSRIERKEMMDFVPRKPSLNMMMSNDQDYNMNPEEEEITSSQPLTTRGLGMLGISL